MVRVTIRELRSKGGEVVDRASRGEDIVITRAGKPVASLRPVALDGVPADVLLARWRTLPLVNGDLFRADLDDVLDPSL